ncbi:MAG: class I SAM-dependent methyltransferase, partial [Phycisphaerales bacterium]
MTSRCSQISFSRVLADAGAIAADYQERIRNIPYQEKGMLFSELLLVVAAASSLKPKQVLESGRARGQSTYVLGACLPQFKVVSVERDPDSSDVPIAESRLGGLPNVAMLYGDAQVLLPALVQPGDVVVIDGPKSFRAVRLALLLLRTGRPACVFLHDVHKGLPERQFLDREIPAAFFSDDEQFVKQFSHLDKPCWDTIADDGLTGWQPHRFNGVEQESYGPTLGCLPFVQGCSYGRLLAKLAAAGCLARMRQSTR